MGICLLVGLLWQVDPTATNIRIGRMTMFSTSREDRGNPHDQLACLHRPLKDTDKVIASYGLPCGTRVVLFNPKTRRTAIGTVADRGPVRTRKNPRLQLYDLDLSKGLARELGFNGDGEMLWAPVKQP